MTVTDTQARIQELEDKLAALERQREEDRKIQEEKDKKKYYKWV